jgi:hypothetical protein
MKILIGNTGLVGQTLKESINFDFEYNSKSIYSYSPPDGCDLYLSCLPSTKWLINKDTKTDIETIVEIIKLIGNVKYKNVYLISTIDVYGNSPVGVNESFDPIFKDFSYGSNRYLFEKMVVKHLIHESVQIFRLPALFSKNIKKNILYDLLHNNNVNMINKNSSFQWYNLNDLVLVCLNGETSAIPDLPENLEATDFISMADRTNDIDKKINFNKPLL